MEQIGRLAQEEHRPRAGSGRQGDEAGLRARIASGTASATTVVCASSEQAALVAEELFRRNYARVMGMLRIGFPGWPEDLCHDAFVDALEEIRSRRQYAAYSSIAEGDLVNRARRRMIDRVRVEARRRRIAPSSSLLTAVSGTGDEAEDTVELIASRARMRELLLPLNQEARVFLALTVAEGLTRDEAAARMQIRQARARRLVTQTQSRLVAFYAALADGSIHTAFEQRLADLAGGGSVADALRDPAICTHLQWCDRCGELLQHPAPSRRAA